MVAESTGCGIGRNDHDGMEGRDEHQLEFGNTLNSAPLTSLSASGKIILAPINQYKNILGHKHHRNFFLVLLKSQMCSWSAVASSPRSDSGTQAPSMLWFFHIQFIEPCQGHCIFASSQWNGKSKENRTWKWCPTLLLIVNRLELSHVLHLISREAGEWSKSVSPGSKGIQFEKMLLHLLLPGHDFWLFLLGSGWMYLCVCVLHCAIQGTYLDAQESWYVLALGSQGVELLGTWWSPSF